MFMVDSGAGAPKVCTQDELTRVPVNEAITRFENKVGYVDVKAGESLIKKQMLERFFVDVVAGEPQVKERAAARFNDLVGSLAGESIVLPRRFRQNRAWLELNKIWRANSKVKGFVVDKVRGGHSVAIAGFIAFLPYRIQNSRRLLSDRFTIESINPKSKQIMLF
ncbi:S1 ribosomal protein [Trema orientale]|uniref:S1 ribosomal protein n=1 Tax=Trema orientale TaxID=63057 RepID=A0A2P5G0R3_TREOI|nr:S1 ribosomal protein [Trema orientale]